MGLVVGDSVGFCLGGGGLGVSLCGSKGKVSSVLDDTEMVSSSIASDERVFVNDVAVEKFWKGVAAVEECVLVSEDIE